MTFSISRGHRAPQRLGAERVRHRARDRLEARAQSVLAARLHVQQPHPVHPLHQHPERAVAEPEQPHHGAQGGGVVERVGGGGVEHALRQLLALRPDHAEQQVLVRLHDPVHRRDQLRRGDGDGHDDVREDDQLRERQDRAAARADSARPTASPPAEIQAGRAHFRTTPTARAGAAGSLVRRISRKPRS